MFSFFPIINRCVSNDIFNMVILGFAALFSQHFLSKLSGLGEDKVLGPSSLPVN